MSIIPGFSSQKTNIFDPLSLDRWDPFHHCPFLKDMFTGCSHVPSSEFVHVPIDWKETADAHVITAELPGLKKQDVTLVVEEGRVLTISGEKKKKKKEEEVDEGGSDTWHREERRVGRFERRLRMPENAKVEEAKAEMDNGVLTVTVPKGREVEKVAVSSVEISG